MQSQNVNVKLDGYQMSNDRTWFIDGYVSATSFITAPLKVGRKLGYCATLSCPATGTPLGVIKVQICNDEERDVAGDRADNRLVNWVDLSGATSPVSGASSVALEDRAPKYRWMRFVYTRTSGSITATITMHTKQLD